MSALQFQGHAFPEDFFLPEDGILWQERKWHERLDKANANNRYRSVRYQLSRSLGELSERQQARATVTHLLRPLAEIFGWQLVEKPERVETAEGEEELGHPISVDSDSEPILYVRALAPEASFDSPPEGHHRRFAPTLVMERALLEKGLNFGILLNGTSLRILHFESGLRSWLEFDLNAIAEGHPDGQKAWLLLWALLSRGALLKRNLWDAVAEARQHALKVGEDLGKQVQEAVKILLNAVVSHPENQSRRSQLIDNLPQLYEEALRFLYRLLFVFYAEARGLLPLDLPAYYDGYSLSRWAKWAFDNRNRLTERDNFLEATVKALFRLLWEGADLGTYGKIPAYKGNLFSPDATPTLNEVRIGDKALAEILTRLAYRQTGQGWRRVSYRTLAVEHIGSVYETLLEFRPEAAKEPMWEVQVNGRVEVLNKAQLQEVLQRRPCLNPEQLANEPDLVQLIRSASQPQKALRINRKLSAGEIFLRSGFRRKQTGTYFTHPALVNFLVRKTLEPLVEGKSPEELLQLKIVDPAMGSGHFLVGACRFLAEKLLEGYKQRFAKILSQNPGLPESEIFPLAQIPPQVARVWNDEERALAACKLLVANHCLYGVDKNPLAVDLAKVTLWIETAAADQPLTFLDHRFKVGDSLLGIPLKRILPQGLFTNLLRERLNRAFNHLQTIADIVGDDPANLDDLRTAHKAMEDELETFWQLHQIAIGAQLTQGSDNRWQQFLNSGELEKALKAGEALREIGEENFAFCWELAFPDVFFEPEGNPKENGGFDAVLGNPPWDKVKPQELEFYADIDPLIGDYQGQDRKDRIKYLQQVFAGLKQKWDAYERSIKAYSEFLTRSGVYRHQFATLCKDCGALLPELTCPTCKDTTPMDKKCAFCGTRLFGRNRPFICPNCNADLDGKVDKTGGDPDLYRFFAERAWQLAKNGGYVGFLLPAAFYATEGATALRRLLLDKSQMIACFSFENRQRLFPIDIRFKFATVVYRKGGQTTDFPAAFMLHDPKFLELPETSPEKLRRQVTLTKSFLERTSPAYRLFLEVKNELERQLADRLHQKFPRLGEKIQGVWNVSFTRELDMTNDAYLFRTAEQLERNLAVRQDPDPQNRIGGILYRTPDAETYRKHGYRVVFVPQFDIEVALPSDALPDLSAEEIESELRSEWAEEQEEADRPRRRKRPKWEVGRPRKDSMLREVLARGFVCEDEYVPLYEGKMVHQFDPAAKAYVSGERRSAVWQELDWHEKHLCPHFFVSRKIFRILLPSREIFRVGFCGVTGATNERTLLTSIVPGITPCGNAVPTLVFQPEDAHFHLLWEAVANSFCVDWLTRIRVRENLNFVFVAQLPFPRLSPDEPVGRELVKLSARLNCVIPELAELWEEVARHYPQELCLTWRLPAGENDPDFHRLPCIDPKERQFLRARIDALVTDVYGLSVEEFAYILSTFPLLDRDQPALPKKRADVNNPEAEREPKSTVTRDLALVAYMLHKGWLPSPFGETHPDFHRWLCDKLGINAPTQSQDPNSQPPIPQIPSDLANWFAQNVPEANVPEMGEIRDLEERLFIALKQLNAIAYIPTRREGEEEGEQGEEETEQEQE